MIDVSWHDGRPRIRRGVLLVAAGWMCRRATAWLRRRGERLGVG